MSDQDVYIVVGDAYENFARYNNVLTATSFRKSLKAPGEWRGSESIVLGLGLGHKDKLELERALNACQINWSAAWTEPAKSNLTHKANDENALISSPRRLAPGWFEFDFVLSDAADRLSDHVTGQHIGAIPLMEAARQACIATLELEFLNQMSDRHGLVVDTFDTKFLNYVFPLPTILRVHVQAIESASPPHLRLNVDLIQASMTCCLFSLGVRMLPSRLLDKIETKSAKKALGAAFPFRPERPERFTTVLQEKTPS